MATYVWLFPILFIFHDMEEIIGLIPWYQKNKELLGKRFPKICKVYENVSTEGFAFAVFEELVLCIAICVISLFTQWYGLWLGGLIGCTIHFAIHIIQSVAIKKYIPALITSVMAVPVGCIVIRNSLNVLNYSIEALLLYSAAGIALVSLNLKFAHWLMKKFTFWMEKWGCPLN
ncbi:MAG: HXXEE domain-containing protein [Lachnospiraceae bacterium]|nr:HXXEE domain-containing protein [Lachnospiraceae bacterium]